jgi:large subunit ribosomal protein L28
MAGRCEICQRKPMYGNNVPFSQHRTRRRFVVNVQKRKITAHGMTKQIHVCTRCIRTLDKLAQAA